MYAAIRQAKAKTGTAEELARRIVDLEADGPAQALAVNLRGIRTNFLFFQCARLLYQPRWRSASTSSANAAEDWRRLG